MWEHSSHTLRERALRPAPRGFCGTGSPCTHLQALRESMAKPCSAPRVTFPTRGKSPKARQGLRPLESPSAGLPPFSRSLRCAPSRAGLPSATTKGRFATLSRWENRVLFLPKLHRGSHFLLSIRGAAGALASRMLEGLSYRKQYRQSRRSGDQRGRGPLRRRCRNQEVPGESLPTFFS